jgi:hypothetical protein
MTISPAAVMPLLVAAFLAGAPAVLARTDQPRRADAARSMSFKGQAARPASQARPALPRAPTRDEKNWMDRASSASNGGAGGGM